MAKAETAALHRRSTGFGLFRCQLLRSHDLDEFQTGERGITCGDSELLLEIEGCMLSRSSSESLNLTLDAAHFLRNRIIIRRVKRPNRRNRGFEFRWILINGVFVPKNSITEGGFLSR
ncbi:hypothetical protein KM043_006516 [Ampulex compressa]|nr:hypothetical protein KM043_006516 [Ampulex compressa]